MEFNIVKRQALIVWLYTLKQLKNIRKYGQVHYISKKLRYVVLYIDGTQQAEIEAQLAKLHFVQKVERSYRDTIDMTWKNAIANRKDKDAQPEATFELHRDNAGTNEAELIHSIRSSMKQKEKTS